MVRYVAFLRGINVGGHRVTGPQLAAVFSSIGCVRPMTFLASGNVIFDAGEAPDRSVIERELATALGYEVPALLRSGKDTAVIAERQPFDVAAVEASDGKLQVILLSRPPSAEDRTDILQLATDADRLAFDGRELYWLPEGGIQQSDLDLARIERMLGPTTMRTKNTVERIAGKFLAEE